MKQFHAVLAGVCLVVLGFAASATAQDAFQLQPFEFDPDNACDVTAQWQNGEIVLAKDCTTATNAAAGIDIISELEGQDIGNLTELNFEYENGGHCGAGAPRFNVLATDGFHFLGGCANGTQTPNTPQAGWTRVRIDPSNPAQAFPPIAPGAKIISIDIVFDEGVDAPPDFSGIVVLDNIDVNGVLVGRR